MPGWIWIGIYREALRAEAPNVKEVLAADEAREGEAPTTTLAKNTHSR